MAVMPIVTLVLAHFFVDGERLNWAKGCGFALGFAGVVILMGPSNILAFGGSGSSLLAQLAIIGGAICYAVNTIIARFCPLRDSLVIAACTACAANIFVLPITFGELPASVGALDGRSLMALATLGVVSTALAPLVYFKLIRLAGPSFLSTMNYLIPLWAVLIGMIFLGETPAWSALAALALILSGIGLSQFKPRAGKFAPHRSISTGQILSRETKRIGWRTAHHPSNPT